MHHHDPPTPTTRLAPEPARRCKGIASCRLAVLFVMVLAWAHAAEAQVLRGEWVDQADERIRTIRKVPLRVIVVDASDRAVENVPVHIEQLEHDFVVGFSTSPEGWPADHAQRDVWRVMNAVSFDRLTRWPDLQPQPHVWPEEQPRHDRIIQLMREAAAAFTHRHDGPVISADFARNPDWLVDAGDRAMRDAVDDYVRHRLERIAPYITQLDLYGHGPEHRFVQQRLGEPMLRRLYEQSRAAAPCVSFTWHYVNALYEPNLPLMIQQVQAMRQTMLPINHVSIEQRFTGTVRYSTLRDALERLDAARIDATIVGLEVGGSTDQAAAINLETTLLALFAHSRVRGVYFSGVGRDQFADPTAALLDEQGQPTASGRLLDQLFMKHWRSLQTHRTDDIGNVNTRVFAGKYHIRATLADGTVLDTTVRLTHGSEHNIVFLQDYRVDDDR